VAADLAGVSFHPDHDLLAADRGWQDLHQRPRVIRTADRKRTEEELPDAAAVLAAYRHHFGILLDQVPVVAADAG
jgi:hypothetical protein